MLEFKVCDIAQNSMISKAKTHQKMWLHFSYNDFSPALIITTRSDLSECSGTAGGGDSPGLRHHLPAHEGSGAVQSDQEEREQEPDRTTG